MNTDTTGVTKCAESTAVADLFENKLEEITVGPKSNEELVETAQQLIHSLGERGDPNEFVPGWYRRYNLKANVHKILEAMLVFSKDCGGERSQRYVACAVIACTTAGTKSSDSDLDSAHRALTDLAISWFANFLWVFKANGSHWTQETTPITSGESTPTLQDWHEGPWTSAHRSSSMKDKVLEREGFICPITGLVDTSFKTTLNNAKLRCAHILKRVVVEFPSAESMSSADKNKHRFMTSTWDILAFYTSMNHEELLEIVKQIDSPSNGIIMQWDWRNSFDYFDACLVPIPNKPNRYKLKNYERGWPAGLTPVSSEIFFEDHSNTGIELPRVELIKLHTALCGILHTSGAGDDIDNLVRDLNKESVVRGYI